MKYLTCLWLIIPITIIPTTAIAGYAFIETLNGSIIYIEKDTALLLGAIAGVVTIVIVSKLLTNIFKGSAK